MLLACFIYIVLAIALPSLRISPLTRVVAIVLLHTVVILFITIYIQSIGSGMVNFSELFTNFLFAQSSIGLEEIFLLLFSLIPVKPKRVILIKAERSQFCLSQDLKDILVGLILGDLYINKPGLNARLCFKQGIIHKEYLEHLYGLFTNYCSSAPVISNLLPDSRTGQIYTRIYFYRTPLTR